MTDRQYTNIKTLLLMLVFKALMANFWLAAIFFALK